MRSARCAVLLVVGLAALGGCARRPPSPTAPLDRAAAAALANTASPRELALAAFHAYVVEGDVEKAQRWLDQSLEADRAEPYALYGQLLMARRRAHPEAALAAALDLCERAPKHPLAVAAARAVFESAGAAIPLDDLILRRAPQALAAGVAGDAAQLLRSALATIQAHRGDRRAHAEALAAMGTTDRYVLLGPLSPYHLLTFDEPTEPERTGVIGPLTGPFGPVTPRVVTFHDGQLSLSAEGPHGDVYVLAVDVEVKRPGPFVVRTVSASPHKVYVDGTLLITRRSFERFESTTSARGVELEEGRHRVLVRLSKDDQSGSLSLGVMRADGGPADLQFSIPEGAPAGWAGVTPIEIPLVYPDARDLAAALEPEIGELLAEYIAIRDGMARDRDGAKRLMAHLTSHLAQGPAITGVRAALSLGDRTVPTKVGRGRATRDLEATLARDPGDVIARLQSASIALEDGRNLEAHELLKQARSAHAAVGFPVALLQARVDLALDMDAQAEQSAQEALKLQPGLCEALAIRYDLARRRDAVALSDELVRALEPCPGSLSRGAEHARSRGQVAEAAQRYEELVARDPSHLATTTTLANLYVSMRKFDEAAALLSRLRALWPRNALLAKRLGDVYEHAGKPAEALKQREQALALDGSDLQLRRMVERAKTGKELLADHAIDTRAAIAAYEAEGAAEDAASVYVLDAAAVQVLPDGSTVDRIHIIQKALAQSGVSEVAEIHLPQGVQVLSLRTLKPDGTVLEPENIEGKESVSLPGVQIGDYVEYEYLQANPSRGPTQPGFTAGSFYFQIARQPNHWSTYTVVAPRGMGLTVDAHHLKAPTTRREGDQEIFSHEQRRVAPYIPEPSGPPSANEYLPFVTVGAGTQGHEKLVAAYADAFLDRARITFEVEAFARQAAEGKTGLDAVRALHAAVHEKIQGRDSGLSMSAAGSLAQERGSRLTTLKAALEAVGIPARLAVVRTFATDPAPYLFPNESLLPYVCLRVELPEGPVWLDPSVRFAPFGELPEQALGGREAYLLPEPGRPLARVETPAAKEPSGKRVELELQLSPEGDLSGRGAETYVGFEAAQLAEALEALSPDRRNQALQSALSRYFGGAELSKLTVDLKREVGAPLTVAYEFVSRRFARVEPDGTMVLGALTFPAQLGRRYVQLGARRTPLYIDNTEASSLSVRLKLPAGYAVRAPAAEIKSGGRFGRFVRRERQEKDGFRIEEEFQLQMARIPPDQYDAFAQFAGEVDLVQGRELVLEKR